MQIILDLLEMFRPDTTCGEILNMQKKGDIDVYQMVESLVDTEFEKRGL